MRPGDREAQPTQTEGPLIREENWGDTAERTVTCLEWTKLGSLIRLPCEDGWGDCDGR